MKRFLLTAAALLVATGAPAQIYQWQDEKDQTVISDRPPAGKVRQLRKVEVQTAAPAPGAETGTTVSDRDMEFRRRQKASAESAAKVENEQRASAQKQQDCETLRRDLRILESGERVALRDANGERYYLDEAQREQGIARGRQAMMQGGCK